MRRMGLVVVLGSLILAGCATLEEQNFTEEILTPEGLPLTVGFVYEETVYAVGKRFSMEKEYWNYLFPEAAKAFQSARVYPTKEDAVEAGVDIIAVGHHNLHGAKEAFGIGVKFVLKDDLGRFMLERSYEDKTVTPDNADTVMASFGRRLKTQILKTKEIKALAREK